MTIIESGLLFLVHPVH